MTPQYRSKLGSDRTSFVKDESGEGRRNHDKSASLGCRTSSTTKSVKQSKHRRVCSVDSLCTYREHRKHNHNAGYQNGHPIIDIYEVIDNMIAEQLDWALILQVHALSTWVCHGCCILR